MTAQPWPPLCAGYDIETWRGIGSQMGWREGVDYVFRCAACSRAKHDGLGAEDCLPTSPVARWRLAAHGCRCMFFADLLNGTLNGTCDVGVGGITVSTAREQAGYEFSFPVYAASLAVMVAVDVSALADALPRFLAIASPCSSVHFCKGQACCGAAGS